MHIGTQFLEDFVKVNELFIRDRMGQSNGNGVVTVVVVNGCVAVGMDGCGFGGGGKCVCECGQVRVLIYAMTCSVDVYLCHFSSLVDYLPSHRRDCP